ncbi:uncharacterized protein LOC113559980 [Rhopalosiphum maidis]|uniref:uncharacterized protein LOC113559980 n=1 Tax=Rhopalosiphum maidis TaxID=43146 RepID=UPI000F009C22|nr:uncharacterized protein LOC113559980 [Rhopalosiphum maidis]
MFQPFRGKWVQSLACFISKDVTTDGATWNRSMWSKFGISKENISCVHMHDESGRLWFISDFPHLIKNMRNCMVRQEEFWTPDGVIKLNHWDDVITSENQSVYNLKIYYLPRALCK